MEGIVELLLVMTGNVLVRTLSLGKWRGESLTVNESGSRAAAGALTFVLNGQRVVTGAGLTLLGMAFYVALFGALYWAFSA